MKAIDLVISSKGIENEANRVIRSYEGFTEKHEKYKIGDNIEFYAGYYKHILYKSKIIGFDKEGGIYVLWSCYWFPIKDDKDRKIRKI